MAAITTTGTLTAGNSRTFALAPGSALTLTLLPNCRVTVTETPETVSASDAGGNSPRTHNHQLAGVVTYGPYAMGGSVVVDNASNSGSTVTWGRKDTVVSTDSTGTSLVSGDGNLIRTRPRRVNSMLGAEAFDLVAVSGLPAGASFSGAGSYASAGVLAVQSTGIITHNPTGWYDGTACLEFTPNTDTNAEFRIYNAAGLNISDEDGIAFEFGLPEPDTSKVNFNIFFDFNNDATNLFPTNNQYVRVWVCDQITAQTKEKGGQKYVRNLWDATAATDAACGAWPGVINTGVQGGTGADRTALVKWFRFRMNKFSGQTLKFRAVRRGGRSTPCFVLGSDNAGPETLFSSLAYAASKELPTYLAQYLSNLTGTVLDGYRRASAAGVEITGDDIVDRALGSTVLDEATMRAAVEGTRDGLAALGFVRGTKVWVANNNSTSALMIRELARAGYVANRNGATDGRYVFPEGGVKDPFRLPALSIDQLNWTAIQPVIDRAITYGCTSWLYWHGVLSSARIDADRTANVTGTAGAPIARSGTESPSAYRARALALGTAIGTASVTYFDARIGSAALAVWWEELKQMFDYLAPKNLDGTCAVLGPEDWCRDVGLLPGP